MDNTFSSFSPTLRSILEQGTYLIVRDFGGQKALLNRVHRLIKEKAEQLHGPGARSTLEREGLTVLHKVLSAKDITALRDEVMEKIRPALFDLTVEIARDLLGIKGEFFVDEYTILRMNYPYLVAMQAPESAENPGIGRTSHKVKELSKASRVVDPVYNPKAYHNFEPPPAWAHGPHQDTWTGHSRLGVNLWWAIDEVFEENSMVFYPETFGLSYAPDPRSLYLASGFPLPKPSKMALRAGEMIIFNPEMLHGTHLNSTDRTRIALSTRINARKPTFDPGCFYAREFWHSSEDLERKDYEKVIRFERAQNLNSEPVQIKEAKPTAHPELILENGLQDGLWIRVCESERIAPRAKLQIRRGSERILIYRGDERLYATQSQCAHLDVSLVDGFHDERTIFCPAHALAFSLEFGVSSCPSLTLRTYPVKEQEGVIWLQLLEHTEARAEKS